MYKYLYDKDLCSNGMSDCALVDGRNSGRIRRLRHDTLDLHTNESDELIEPALELIQALGERLARVGLLTLGRRTRTVIGTILLRHNVGLAAFGFVVIPLRLFFGFLLALAFRD